MYTTNSSMTAGMGWRVSANIVANFAWQCIVAWMSACLPQRAEVQRLLGGRAAVTLDDVAVEVAHDEIVERHLR